MAIKISKIITKIDDAVSMDSFNVFRTVLWIFLFSRKTPGKHSGSMAEYRTLIQFWKSTQMKQKKIENFNKSLLP